MAAITADRLPQWTMQYCVKPCTIAGFFVLVAFLWTLLFQHAIAYPFLFLFIGAGMGSAWFGGIIAGFIAVGLSSLLVDYFFVPPILFHVRGAAVADLPGSLCDLRDCHDPGQRGAARSQCATPAINWRRRCRSELPSCGSRTWSWRRVGAGCAC